MSWICLSAMSGFTTFNDASLICTHTGSSRSVIAARAQRALHTTGSQLYNFLFDSSDVNVLEIRGKGPRFLKG